MTEDITTIPEQITGSLEELQEALKQAYLAKQEWAPRYRYNMNEVLNRQRAKQNRVAKWREKNKSKKKTNNIFRIKVSTMC